MGQTQKSYGCLHEMNPMLGHRGCRLSITYPEIAEMQTQAVIEAAIEINTKKGANIIPEIMIPLVGDVKELKYVKNVVTKTAEKVMASHGVKIGKSSIVFLSSSNSKPISFAKA